MAKKINHLKNLSAALSAHQRKWAFEKAGKAWPGVELGLVGRNTETGAYYFQERGNPAPFIIGADGKKVDV